MNPPPYRPSMFYRPTAEEKRLERLEAAAPDLLAALEFALERLEKKCLLLSPDKCAIGMARAAIAKATGNPS